MGHMRRKRSPFISSSHPANSLDHKELLLTFLGLAVLVSFCLAAVSLYYVTALKTELAALTNNLNYRVQRRMSFPLSFGHLEKSKEARSFIPPHLKVLDASSSQVS